MKNIYLIVASYGISFGALIVLVPLPAQAAILRIGESSFRPDAGLVTFSELTLQTANPFYTPQDYGGLTGGTTVSFGGFFQGQSLGTAQTCPPGAALTGCIQGNPLGSLALDPNSPQTFIVQDIDNPSSPVLSGFPIFNGAISILFSKNVAAVGLEGGYFNTIGATAITAFGRDGTRLGAVNNTVQGIEFLGLVSGDGSNQIAGLQFSLVGPEPQGFAIDNLRFGRSSQVNLPIPPSPSPSPTLSPSPSPSPTLSPSPSPSPTLSPSPTPPEVDENPDQEIPSVPETARGWGLILGLGVLFFLAWTKKYS